MSNKLKEYTGSKAKCCCMLKMKITISMEDFYNFNNGQADLTTGASDNINGRFENLGWARSFYSRGRLTRTVKWCKGDAESSTRRSGGGRVRDRRGGGRGRSRDRNRNGRDHKTEE